MRTTAKTISRILGGPAGTTHQPSMRARISLAALTVAGLSAAVKLASLGLTLLIAAIFGTGDDLDAFFIAFMVPSFAITVIAGSFSSAMVPALYSRDAGSKAGPEAQELLSRVMVLAAVLLCGATAVAIVVVPYLFPVLASGFSDTKILLTRDLFFVLLPVIAVKGMAVIYASILHAHKRFTLVAAAPVSVPVSSVLVILVWADDSTRNIRDSRRHSCRYAGRIGCCGVGCEAAGGRYSSASIRPECREWAGHCAVSADGRRRPPLGRYHFRRSIDGGVSCTRQCGVAQLRR